VRLHRYLKPHLVKLELETLLAPRPEKVSEERHLRETKEAVVAELARLVETSGRISNAHKLLTDLLNRERKASTAVGRGVAIPHVRTIQAKDLVIAFARSTPGVPYDAPDGAPVHLFFVLVAPPYDDQVYLKFYKAVGDVLAAPGVRETLLQSRDPHEVIALLARGFSGQ
jgi:mannitol/fructose-specific phosphotransferase system IIA component (Ntr-type)